PPAPQRPPLAGRSRRSRRRPRTRAGAVAAGVRRRDRGPAGDHGAPMSKEIELKLSLPAKALPALRRHPLVAAAAKRGATVTLDNTYYDTPDLTLKTRKVAVRTRRQGRRWLQTVKCAAPSTGGLSARPEWEQPYAGCFDFSA